MDIKELSDAKRTLSLQVCQEIREFEQKTGMQVTGIKINRDCDEQIESIAVKAEMSD